MSEVASESTAIARPATESNDRIRLGEWLAALTVLLAVLGMAMSSPALTGPDEPAHQATASYLTVHILPPRAETQDYVAGILKFGACMADKPELDASCEPGRDDVSAAKVRLFNYPPPYYWVVGLGQKFAPEADRWMDVGGRVASLLLNLVGLALVALLVRRRSHSWGTNLLLVTPPMAAFLWAVVNPSGWEITAALLFATVLSSVWWGSEGRRRDDSAKIAWWAVVAVAVSSLALAFSRHDGIVWMILLILAIMLMARSPLARGAQVAVVLATGVGLIAGLIWQVLFPAQHVLNNPDRLENPGALDYLHWFGQIDEFLPVRLRQMVGVLGWLDTPVPQILFVCVLIGWAALIGLLMARTRIPLLALLVGFLGTFLVPTLFEVVRWNDWPYWYQGRITLPFTLAFLLVLLLRFGSVGRRAAVGLSLLSSVVLGVMVWLNLMRYAFGIRDYIPQRWSDPAIGSPWYAMTLVVVALIALITITRLVLLLMEKPRLPWIPVPATNERIGK